ncbi:MAG: hypothetical protein DRR00_17600 [Candidatus Parabeggiatoa sp. nov. 3]|nr:MAG: hypothetical protein DRR00_17600 [Gammaproteobacteria bacterium]RKZ65331.1 MAG: hypothetical protein DRQ99_12955 [Gammaproteobacteria bacterium]HEW97645.1 hypothetical protein [Beggiatoa sp.]
MKPINCYYSCLFLLSLHLAPLTSHAILEDIQIGLQPHTVPLRWDNIKEAPLWVKGIAPEFNSNWGLYQVTFDEPDDFVTVWLAEGHWLRLHNPDDPFPIDALEIAVSYGTGLYADVSPYPAKEGHSLLLTPDLSKPRLVRIRCSPQQEEAVTLALFASRHQALPEIAPQYQDIPLDTDAVTLHFSTPISPGADVPISELTFWRLDKQIPTTLKVNGPTELSLESRYIYPPKESVLQQAYRVSIYLDDQIMRFLEFETSVDNLQTIFMQGNPVVLGRAEKTVLKIPEGEHELQLETNANLYIRFISKEPETLTQYLFPEPTQGFQVIPNTHAEFALPQRLSQFEDTFWLLHAETPVNIKAQGPAQLRLESRLFDLATQPVGMQPLDYRVAIRLNDESSEVLELETPSDYQQSLLINDKQLNLKWPNVTSFTLPQGEHDLQLSGNAPLYVRLMSRTPRQVSHPGYLFSNLNRPQPEINAITENPVPEWLNQSVWQLKRDELRTLYLTHIDTLEAIRHIAFRFVRDNSRREGGLLGAMAMFEAARRQPYEAKMRRLAKQLLGRYTFSRNLLPWRKQHEASQTFHRFMTYQLRDPNAENQPLVVAEQHRDAYLKRISGAYFAPLAANETAAQIYKLPKRTVPSFLQVVVKQQTQLQTQTFFLQFDDDAPIRMQVDPYIFEVPSHYYRYAQGEAGLKMLALAHGTDADTLGGPFASRYQLGPLIDAATLVLPLPPDVRQIKVWQSPSPSSNTMEITAVEPLQVALQYRAARRHYRLSETEYLEAASQFESPQALFEYFVSVLKTFTGNHSIPPTQNETQRDLYNYWLPFLRFLRGQNKHFMATVYRTEAEKQTQVLLNQTALNRLTAQAHQAEKDQQWLNALEIWTQIVRGSQGSLHREAQLAREEALEQLGEVFLAKRLLQGLFIDSADPVLAQHAFDKLLSDYQQSDDKSGQVSLLVTAALRHPTPALFKQLTEVLIENGYDEYAVMIGMALPPALRPNNLLMAEVYRLGWWQTFDRLLQYLPEEEQKLWLGYRAQDKGDYATAIRLWREEAGIAGQSLANALETGQHIREQLQLSSEHSFKKNVEQQFEQQAIDDWGQWQAEHPGKRQWKTADHLIHDYASAELTYSIERDLYFYSFIATPQRPVKLRLPGPLQVQFSVRTLHPKDNIEPINTWVKIKTQNQRHVLQLSHILPSRGLHIVGQPDKRLGHQTLETYAFGPGLHEIDIWADDQPIAVKVKIEQPRLPLAVLPPLNKDTLTVALMLQDAQLSETSACQFVASAYPERGEQIRPSVEPNFLDTTESHSTDRSTYEHTEPLSQCRRIMPVSDCQCLDCVLLMPYCVTFTSYNQYVNRSTVDILKHLHRWQAKWQLELPVNTPAFSQKQLSKALARGDLEALPPLTGNESDSDIVKRMRLLLWISEQSPALVGKIVVAGAALFKQHPKVPKLRSLWAALRTNHHWKNVQSIETSAGLHLIKIKGWQPESPSQRIRKTLLKPVSEAEQVITGHRQMGLSVFNLATTRLELRLRMDDVTYFRPAPMNVVYWLDEQPHQRLRLTPQQPNQTVDLAVPEGEHILYVAIDKPLANQFLRLQVKEIKSPSTSLNDSRNTSYQGDNIPLILEYERAYHIATPEEPVVANVLGPTWLRIDEWLPDSSLIESRYQALEAGWHTLTLGPRKEQTSALLRLHQMTAVTEQTPEVQLRYFSTEPEIMPDPIVQIHKLPPISRLDVKDAYPLGEQEEGTWSFTGLAQRRRNVEEDESGFQDFLELRATHRYFDHINRRHHKTEGLIRFNDHFDITLGAKKFLRYRSEAHNLSFQLAGLAYMQQVQNQDIEWHGFLKPTLSQRWPLGDKTVTIPSVSLFGRLLSRDDSPDEYAARVDNDVYSDYKAEHRYGLTLADQIRHRPWLDTLWIGRAGITSNENLLDPDYLSLKAQWKQMLGDGQLNLGYRFTHYWADDDRRKSVNRHFLLLDLNWNMWQQNQTRWELGAKLQQDLDNDELLGMLYISWHGGEGRAYRDFMPGEIDFLNLRKRRIPYGENNEIIRFD